MTLNVLIIELATNISVWIPVKVAFLVERVHNVLLLVTGQFANAPLVGEEIHLPNVSNVSLARIKKNCHCSSVIQISQLLLFSVDECLTNNDCPQNKACISKECVDPCIGTVCGSRALCKVELHAAICYCPPGLQGNERVACIEVKCTTNADCASNEKCDYPRGGQRKECLPLCVEPRCVLGAICSASNHIEECTCRPPLKGDGFVSCNERKSFSISLNWYLKLAKFEPVWQLFFFLV